MQIARDTAAVELQMELWVAGPETGGPEQTWTLCTTKGMGTCGTGHSQVRDAQIHSRR